MNKNAIKKFAIEARKKLIASVSDRAGMLGITPEGCSEPVSKGADFEIYKTIAGTEITLSKSQCEQRRKLKEQVETRGFEAVVEEVAYTWFNRICAIRFMEVNDYLPTRVRVLSSEKEGKNEPDIVTQAPDVELDFTDKEREYILDCKINNKLDELFKMLFIKQCNKLSEILPELFEATEDYTEMLLNISYTNKDDIIYMLVNQETGIPEADFNVSTIGEDGQPTGQVEIIGWLYQYYNTELKDDTFAQLKKNIKISKERIPAATQLFTPDWIVRYMVENSVGRLWIEHLRALDPTANEKEIAEKFGWKYYLPEAEQEADVNVKLAEIRTFCKDLKPEDITCIDPCMGSGHILVAMFDVLMDIYKSAGYSERDAAFEIVEHNIHGLDIDKRAYQLAYFAVMMKGRGYNRRFLRITNDAPSKPKIYAIKETNMINVEQFNLFGNHLADNDKNIAIEQIKRLIEVFRNAREYGSIIQMEAFNWELLEKCCNDMDFSGQISFDTIGIEQTQKQINEIISLGKLLDKKYDVVITNPPYMGNSGMSAGLSTFVKQNYPDTKTDMYSCFIERNIKFLKQTGYVSMVTMESWMFLSSFEKMRHNILDNNTILSMVHMPYLGKGNTSMGINFGTTAFIIQKKYVADYAAKYDYICYYDLDDCNVPREFPVINERYKATRAEEYYKIPGMPIAYWLSKEFIKGFSMRKISEDFIPKFGMSTGDGEKFIRYWHEVNIENICFENYKEADADTMKESWVPIDKGGPYRRWYGNQNCVVWWKDNGNDIRNHPKSAVRSPQYFFKPHISWTLMTTGIYSARMFYNGFAIDTASNCLYFKDEISYEVLGFLNSKIAREMLQILNPTINFSCGVIGLLPFANVKDETIADMVKENIEIAKSDWDSFEYSWNYAKHPLCVGNSVSTAYDAWAELCKKRRNALRENEEMLNKKFSEIFNIYEIDSEVGFDELCIEEADVRRECISLISYAVGCMLGRYSLDQNGIVYAGGKWNEEKYQTYLPDVDNIIPITEEEYFKEDIVGRFCEWLKVVYGAETLEENLDFIAKVLGNKGKTSRETIREYFVNDFITDHIKIYQKRPIYWMFDSGKANGFKALVYMHRYNSDTVAKVRVDYLHNIQKSIEQAKVSAEYLRDNGSGAEKAKATKLITKYTKQLAEIHLYDEAMAHIANQRIDIDLDDGVKVNYEKFQGVEVAQEGKKALKIDLLAKIK